MGSDNLFDRLGTVLKDYIADTVEAAADADSKTGTSDMNKTAAKDAGGDKPSSGESGKNRIGQNHSGQKGRPGQKSRARGIVYKALSAPLIEDFTILGLFPDADFQSCKKRYKQLLHLYHPDKYGDGTREQDEASALTMRIHQAFKNIEGYFIQYGSAAEKSNTP